MGIPVGDGKQHLFLPFPQAIAVLTVGREHTQPGSGFLLITRGRPTPTTSGIHGDDLVNHTAARVHVPESAMGQKRKVAVLGQCVSLGPAADIAY
jgi:hypothetical protein